MPLWAWILVIFLLLGYGGGLNYHVGGEAIHVVLIVVVALVIWQIVNSRRGPPV